MEHASLERLYWKEGLNLRQIGKIYGRSAQTILNWMRKHGIPRRTGSELGKFIFKRSKKLQKVFASRKIIIPNLTPSPDLCYIIGVLLGDGWVNSYLMKDYRNKAKRYYNHRVGLAVKDNGFADSFRSALIKIGLNAKTWRAKRGFYKTHATSKLFVEWYRGLKIHDIEEIISQNDTFAASFIRGFYDSEGSLSKYRYKECVSMSNTNLEVINLIRRVLEKLRFNFHLRRRTTHPPSTPQGLDIYELQIGGMQNCQRFISTVGSSITRKTFG